MDLRGNTGGRRGLAPTEESRADEDGHPLLSFPVRQGDVAEMRLACLREAYNDFTQAAETGAPKGVLGGQQYEADPVQAA